MPFRRCVLAIGLGLATAGSAAAAPCASIRGPGDLVAAVRETLAARGVAEQPACQTVSVDVARSADGIVVDIEDRFGRTSQRVVADPAAAATIVESWTRTDDVTALLEVTSPAPPHAPVRDDEVPIVLHHDPSPPAGPELGAALSLESSVGSEGSHWLGLRGTACLAIGPACVGVLVRAASDVSDRMIQHYGVDLLVGTDFAIRRGRLMIVPGLGVGLGWIHSQQVAREMFGFPQPDFDAGGLRADARIAFVLRLGHGLAIELDASFDVSVRADQNSYPSDVTMLVEEPRSFVRGSLGLRYGAP
jgi:hypothetical protein